MNQDRFMATNKVEKLFEYTKWVDEIPFINFPEKWDIKIIHPFARAVIRFKVRYKKAMVSIYLDCYEELGIYGGNPYWEVYPHNDDIYRCGINETKELLEAIQRSIDEQ